LWLRDKYGSLEKVNAAWGTSFWSQEYTEWSQIQLPWQVKCGDHHNPSLQLEFRRFQSQTTVEFQHEQVNVIRKLAPHHFITQNQMGLHNSMDYFDLGRDLDFVSWDNYPITPWGESPFGASLAADVMWGIKQRNVWVMEQQNGIAGWNVMGRRPPGQWLRCAAWQAVAHGADAIVFFRWRSAHHGTEQYWHGALNHDGVPRRRYRELAEFGREMRNLSEELDGTAPHSDVAIVNSYEQHFAMDIQPQAEGLRIWDQVARYYRVLKKSGLNVDVAPITVDLSRYKLVIAPSWYILTEEDAARFTRYVRDGGTLIVNARTGVKDNVNACRAEPLPSLLREVLGVEVDDYDPLGKDESKVRMDNGKEYTVSVWADALLLSGAEAIARYSDSIYPDEPAITRNIFGRGTAYYFGAFGEPALYDDLLGRILDEAGIRDRMQLPEGVDANWREGADAKYLFLLNFNDAAQKVTVPEGLVSVLGDATAGDSVTLPPYGVGIYRCSPSAVRGQDRSARAWSALERVKKQDVRAKV
jgi:beta-galactosidase